MNLQRGKSIKQSDDLANIYTDEQISKFEIERDYYKRESEEKDQTIREYQQELIQCKTKLRQCTKHNQSLEDQLKKQLKEKDSVERWYKEELCKKVEENEQQHKNVTALKERINELTINLPRTNTFEHTNSLSIQVSDPFYNFNT